MKKSSAAGRPIEENEEAEILDFYKDVFLSTIKDKDKDAESLRKQISNIPDIPIRLDPTCFLELNLKTIRIEYPGEVRNVNKAIATLGDMSGIEMCVGDQRNKLTLNFHPSNVFSKKCLADRDFKPGILIKVKKDLNTNNEFKYEVVGLNVMNFTFNRLYDFQYLPLLANPPETKSSKVEYLLDQMFPKQLPDYEWFHQKESKNMTSFLIPVRFSRYDNSHAKFDINGELGNIVDANQARLAAKNKKIGKIFGKCKKLISYAYFEDKEVPTKPPDSCLRVLKNKAITDTGKVKKCFEDRPIWTRAGIQYQTGLSDENIKAILPTVAYHFKNGPFRITWVRYGYDPRKDPNSRIYQTLDYRIRTAGTGETAQLKVGAKRSYRTTKASLTIMKKISLKDNISAKPKSELDERCYILRPCTIPPARQMFYQYCDLLIPEIQDMIAKLPKVTADKVCDAKTGWLPKTFIDKCREIVNNTILQAVQKELLEDKILQEKAKKQTQRPKTKDSMDYCNQMMSNIKKGIYKKVQLNLPGSSKDPDDVGEDAELISLSSDDEDPVGDLIQKVMPENLDDEEEEEGDAEEDESDGSQSSDELDIDMEAVEEINKMINDSTNK